jgi:predicted permease
METFWQDVRFGVRMLAKKPGFAAIAILTLALGIGANTAIFSVVNALLFRPLPFREPSRLVWLANLEPEGGLSGVTTRVANFADWRRMNETFQDLTAYFAFFDYISYTLIGNGEPERLSGVGVSQNFFALLGIEPKLGRAFDEDECKWHGRRAAILSHSFWQRRFGSDPGIIGRPITLNDQATTVVGVMPASFDFASIFSPGSRVDLILPFPISQETDRMGNTLAVIGRLKPGVTIEKAQAEFNLINQQLQQAHPERGKGWGARLTSLQVQISGRFRRAFLVLFCAVGCVLLIACTNLSNLLLARAASRQKEIAVRIALGAERSRLIRQMLTESILLACCGAGLGLPLAYAGTRVLAATRAISIPLLQTVGIDRTALLFTLLVALATGLLFGIVPALHSSGSNVVESLKDASRGSSEGRRGTLLRSALVVSEVALACVLLVGAGLLIRSFLRLLEVDPGFRPEHAGAWRVETSGRNQTPVQQTALYEELIRSIESIPGVESAGLTDCLPLGRNRSWTVRAKGEIYPDGQLPAVFPRIVDHGYIKTMKIPLRAGRDFTPHDIAGSELVILVNETAARRLFPGRDPIGQIVFSGRDQLRVVGVVGDVRHGALEQKAGLEMYLNITQIRDAPAVELVVRSRLSMESLVPTVRAALRKVDPNLPTSDFKTLEQLVDQAVSPRRFVMVLLGGFALLALILASLGIYGVISYSVNQRTNEIGIRVALGAEQNDVLRMIIGHGLRFAGTGLLIGLSVALMVTRVLSGLLFDVSPTDPETLVFVSLLLVLVAFAASYLPARRAAKVDPMVALRYE